MTDQTDLKEQKPFTGKHMLIVMLSFFGVIIIVNLTMATLATRSWTGLVVKNGYIASQEFNKRQQAQEDLIAAGWKSDLIYKAGLFTLTLTKNSKVLENCTVTGLLNRPVHDNDNHLLQFHYMSGNYRAAIQKSVGSQLKPGRWNLEVQALCATEQAQNNGLETAADKFIQSYKFLVPKQPTKSLSIH